MQKPIFTVATILLIHSIIGFPMQAIVGAQTENKKADESVDHNEFNPAISVESIPARIVRLTAHLKVENTSDTKIERIVFRTTLPPDLESQKCILESADTPLVAKRRYKNRVNEYLEFQFSVGPKEKIVKDINFKILLRPVDFFQVEKIEGRPDTDPAVQERYLKPSEYIESDSREVSRVATKIFAEKESELDKVKAAYEYPASRLKFKLQTKTRGAQWALQRKTGDCTEYACLLAALCRTQSIPARRVLVFNLSKHKKKTFTSPNHHIAEVYLNSHGWIPADANLGRGKYDRAIGLGKLGNTFILLNREGASNWSSRIPKDGYDKSKPEPTKKSNVTWDAEVLKEGRLAELEAEFNSESEER